MSYETLNEALIDAVKLCGGSKAVGVMLWGESAGVDNNARKLLACLNPERPEKLSIEEIHQIMRMARAKGCHVVMDYLAESLGYSTPQPIDPRDELADLLRQYLARRARDDKHDERLERLVSQVLGPRAVA